MVIDTEKSFVIERCLERDAFGSYVNFIRFLMQLKDELTSGQAYQWSQNFLETYQISKAEIEQLFGLLGSVDNVSISNKTGSEHTVSVSGFTRVEKIGLLLRWTRPALHQQHACELILESLLKLPNMLRHCLHCIDLDYNSNEQEIWQTNVKYLIDVIAREGKPCFIGVSWSISKFEENDYQERVDFIRDICKQYDIGKQFIFQSVIGAPQVKDSQFILYFAKHNNFSFDFSLLLNIDNGNLLPYDRNGAYYPLNFDLRAKAPFVNINIIEMPKVCGSLLIDEVWAENLYHSDLQATLLKKHLFDNHYENVAKRLVLATESYISDAFSKVVNFDSTAINMWEKYFVFNWSRPPAYDLRLVEFDATSITAPNSSLNRALENKLIDPNNQIFCLGCELLDYIRAQADRRSSLTKHEHLDHQVSGHCYLGDGGRPDITADSRQLLDILPVKLGATLELGCGYGVLAKYLTHKSSLYVGIDLALEQACSMKKLNAYGLICDMHKLSFRADTFNTIVADNVIEHSYDPEGLLKELNRVLVDEGHLYAIIPCDLMSSDYQLRLHLWKSDPESIQVAMINAGFEVCSLDLLSYTRINGYGSFPASQGKTCLVHCRKLVLQD